jgi:[acyl-carrier-protein] S-malonyltransferase
MKPAAKNMENKINNTKFEKPLFEIVNNVTANPEVNSINLKRLLIEQIFSTVRWRESLINMHEKGIKNFLEIGPGKVLSGMAKRTLKDVNCFSINTIADMKFFVDEFKK